MDENSTHRSEPRDEDFLAVPRSQAPSPAASVANPRRTRWTSLVRHPATLVTAGVLAGATVVGAAGYEPSQAVAATTVAASTTAPPGAAAAPGAAGVPDATTVPGRGGTGGQAAPGGAGGGPGGIDGAQQLTGTLSAVDASSITVDTAAGTQTIPVGTSAQVVQDGQEVALSDLAAGQVVVIQVHPSADGWAVQRVLAGATAGTGSDRTVPGAGPPDDQGDRTAATVTT